jgi:hypothetical protein
MGVAHESPARPRRAASSRVRRAPFWMLDYCTWNSVPKSPYLGADENDIFHFSFHYCRPTVVGRGYTVD